MSRNPLHEALLAISNGEVTSAIRNIKELSWTEESDRNEFNFCHANGLEKLFN